MTEPGASYRVSLYNEADEPVRRGLLLPFLPYPGLRLIYSPGAWEVVAAQVLIPDPGSIAVRDGSPLMVDVSVKEARGIHR